MVPPRSHILSQPRAVRHLQPNEDDSDASTPRSNTDFGGCTRGQSSTCYTYTLVKILDIVLSNALSNSASNEFTVEAALPFTVLMAAKILH